MAFHVGMLVICVDDRFNDSWSNWRAPVANQIYTIRAVTRGCLTQGSADGLLLNEIINRKAKEDGREPVFGPFRFRPLTDRKSEVSFTMGADPESKAWDNRRRQKERV